MKIYNAMTGKKENFVPIEENKVRMYACGITVYDLCHIGHARQAIVYAMMADYLKFRGYDVKYVRNYTDVDDKIINRANKERMRWNFRESRFLKLKLTWKDFMLTMQM